MLIETVTTPTPMQATLALSIFFFSFAYEDGATLLAATLWTAGRLDVRVGFVSALLGIWAGDMGLYAVGSSLGQRVLGPRWLGRFVHAEKLMKAEAWFSERGHFALVMSRFIPGSRLPLYLAAGSLRFPGRLFAAITGGCSAVWVSVIFTVWHFAPKTLFMSGKMTSWILAAGVLIGPLLRGKMGIGAYHRACSRFRKYQRWSGWPAWFGKRWMSRSTTVT
jgi:membrane protein DedA with SNARE-associated domain